MSQGDRYWPTFCRALGREDLISGRAVRQYGGAQREQGGADRDIGRGVYYHDAGGVGRERLDAAGDLIWERVQSIMDLPDDPQVVENDYLIDAEHATLGATKWHQTPIGYGETPVGTRRLAPGAWGAY